MTLLAHAEIDQSQLDAARRSLRNIRRGYPRAIRDATTRTTNTVRTRVVKAVAADVNVRQRKLYQKGNARRPITQKLTRGQGGDVVGGHVTVGKGRIPLGRFDSKQHWKAGKKQGRVRTRVSYRIDKRGRRASVKDAFQVEFKSGFVGVFRGWKSRGRRRKLRGTDQLFGPSVPGVAEDQPDVRRLIRSEAANLYRSTLSKRVDALHARAAARR